MNCGRRAIHHADSLSCLAARAIGWSYADLLLNMLQQAWRLAPYRETAGD